MTTFCDILRSTSIEDLFAAALHAYNSYGADLGLPAETEVMSFCRYLKDCAENADPDKTSYYTCLAAIVSPCEMPYFPVDANIFFSHRLEEFPDETLSIFRGAAHIVETAIDEESDMLYRLHELLEEVLIYPLPMQFVLDDIEGFLAMRINDTVIRAGSVMTIASLIAQYLLCSDIDETMQRQLYRSIATTRAIISYMDELETAN